MNSQRSHLVISSTVFLVIVMVLISSCGPAATPQPTPIPSPVDKVSAWVSAYNRHDVDAVMAQFSAQTVSFNFMDVSTQNLQDIHDYFLFGSGMHSHFQFPDCTMTATAVTCKAEYFDDCWITAGVNPLHFSTAIFTFQNGEIIGLDIKDPLTADIDLADTRDSKFFPWFYANYPDDLNKIMSPNGVVHTQDAGEILAKYCIEFSKITN